MKIGLISDTHLSSGQVPQAILDALRGVDMVLHAGDLVTLDVLRRLEAIAPVSAVQGNMDVAGVRLQLPVKTLVEAGSRRIGLIHGHHVPNPDRVLPPPIDFEAIHRYLLSEFANAGVHCIVYGHTHQAHVATYRGVLCINPGSATHGHGGQASVGRLTVEGDAVRGEIIQLT